MSECFSSKTCEIGQCRHFFLKIETNRRDPPYISKKLYMKAYLGEFEELVLLTIATLGDEAYGVQIQKDIEERSNRSISIGALHSTITRLEEKRYLKSWLGGATNERGGRSKRYYEITQAGKKAVAETKAVRDELWDLSKIKLIVK
jgi:PadR family transcriptional regulator, regulatory protein PadR